jgi:hypothetical protein
MRGEILEDKDNHNMIKALRSSFLHLARQREICLKTSSYAERREQSYQMQENIGVLVLGN